MILIKYLLLRRAKISLRGHLLSSATEHQDKTNKSSKRLHPTSQPTQGTYPRIQSRKAVRQYVTSGDPRTPVLFSDLPCECREATRASSEPAGGK